MSTNYYWKKDGKPQPCPTCGHCEVYEPIHIGISASGWNFLLDGSGEFKSWKKWKEHLSSSGGIIFDENGIEWDARDFITYVEGISNDPNLRNGEENSDFQFFDEEGFRISKTSFC